MKDNTASQSKTEPPTTKRLRDLRKKGQVARSADVVATGTLIAGVSTFAVGGAYLVARLQAMLDRAVSADFRHAFDDPAALLQWTQELLLGAVWLVAPIVVVSMVASALTGFIQAGPVFAPEYVKPQLSRLNPIAGCKRVFSLRNAMELLKLVAKTLVLGAIVTWLIWSCLPLLLRSHWLPIGGVLPLAVRLIGLLAWSAVAGCVAIAAFDLWFQRWDFQRRNRMSIEEVRREHKETEGDPHTRARRRQLHREVSTATMLQRVRSASVVLVNPTHIAVALYYEPGETDLPMVLAKGEGQLAQEIRRIAEEEGVPVLHNVALARGLHGVAALDQYIPEEFIEPVAAVLRWVRDHGTE